jgi:hypothetical protein
MSILRIKKLGGQANFGGVRSRLRSDGELDTASLSESELEEIELLFSQRRKSKSSKAADNFRYRITRTTKAGTETVEVPESRVPSVIASCVVDKFV